MQGRSNRALSLRLVRAGEALAGPLDGFGILSVTFTSCFDDGARPTRRSALQSRAAATA
jgi:hypothetical protein